MTLRHYGRSKLNRVTGALLVIGYVPFASPALASDYSHVCRSADGVYVMDDGLLTRSEFSGDPAKEITYRKLSETVIKSETGYCVANAAGGKRFGYESKTYTLRVAFQDNGVATERDLLCELASDGLPAALTCDKQVIEQSTGGSEAPVPPATDTPANSRVWMHNGSVMRLEAKGKSRRFYYDTPREGLVKQGARSGTLLFEGERDGAIYSGTAYIFKSGCKPSPYAVAGDVSEDDRTITMTGDAPRFDSECKVTGTKKDTLIFSYVPGE
jgi:hypothetical protein